MGTSDKRKMSQFYGSTKGLQKRERKKESTEIPVLALKVHLHGTCTKMHRH